jgi:FKBP-type peptidyl-prolyl cis-trans isomerase
MEMKYSKLEKQEKKFLEEFIQRNKISAIPDSSGIYTIYSQHGTGAIADTGKVLTLFFRGRLLDGKVFMASPKDKPYQFVLGRKEVIEGWEHALHQVRVGDRLTLIVPSRYGYGQQGLMNNSDQQFLVPPYSTLIFDIVVAGVDDLSTASK